MLLVLTFALAASAQCWAQSVALSIVRIDCTAPLSPLFPPPASQQEKEQISAEWVGADELAVDAWDEETADSRVDPGSAKVHLDGSALTLSYAHKPAVPDPSKPAAACQSFVKLFFAVSGLARSRYQLRLENGHRSVHELAIDG